ncbi:hypothetical protein O7635_22840 [Asanoa sp. WMMD1127]|uniref:hypothetical protein n=1 Tax=Asanoa sp. WMMD1127 TaxID=3016107 RepID=UPI00241785FA|nr:hypothetical protein [Asanoa sp. WMMD1127]MDG4824698.1 hypothetical protein [Asanoa sp. WMMD1127]
MGWTRRSVGGLAVGAVVAAVLGVGGRTPRDEALGFLRRMMDLRVTGSTPRLARSYLGGALGARGFTDATTYDNAVMLHAFLAAGDERRARVLGDGLVAAQAADPAADGRVRAAYSPDPPFTTATNAASDVGAVAWAAHALATLGGGGYLDAAVAMGEWVERTARDTRGAGGYTGGLRADGTPLTWKATEHNTDLVALFERLAAGDGKWRERADAARGFVSSMWDGDHFHTGTDVDGVTPNRAFVPADAQTWTYLALRDDRFAASLDYAAREMSAVDGPYRGISSRQGVHDQVWFEGTAHLALARRLRGDPDPALLDTIEKVQRAHGPGVLAASRDEATTDHYASLHTGATAWYLLAAAGVNPLAP